MVLIRMGPVSFDAGLVAFDKDGTLIEFEFMWGRLAEAWAAAIVEGMPDESLKDDIYRSWGYDPVRKRTVPQSPLAMATTGQTQTIAAAVLYRHGIRWTEAEDRARSALQQAEAELPLSGLIRPTGDVGGLMSRLRAGGARLAVITTDHRAETEETLRLLAADHLVDYVVCGDDGLPTKPAPDMLLAACQHLGVPPIRTAVVGDTMGDLLMARRAGAGLVVAVRTGAGDPASLAAHADAVIGSIDDISLPAGPLTA